jgi:hypothetical protein
MITQVRIKFDKLMAQTARAYLLKIGNTEYWFPARFCRKFITNQKLGGNTVIPAWLYREKFGCEPDIEDAETIVEHHIPERIEPIEITPDASLTR